MAGVRRATTKDIESIVGLSSGLFREDGGTRDPFVDTGWPEAEGEDYFGAVVGDPGSLCIVAEAFGEVVGYLVGRLVAGSTLRPVVVTELESMYVLDGWRGRGIGASLVREFLRWSGECGARRASVTAYASNEGAVRFYSRHGFVAKSVSLERGVDRTA